MAETRAYNLEDISFDETPDGGEENVVALKPKKKKTKSYNLDEISLDQSISPREEITGIPGKGVAQSLEDPSQIAGDVGTGLSKAVNYWDALDRGAGIKLIDKDYEYKKGFKGPRPTGKELALRFLSSRPWIDQDELRQHVDDHQLEAIGVALDVGISPSTWATFGIGGVARLALKHGPRALKAVNTATKGLLTAEKVGKGVKYVPRKTFEGLGKASSTPMLSFYKYDKSFIDSIIDSPFEDLVSPKKAKETLATLMDRNRLVDESRFIKLKELEAHKAGIAGPSIPDEQLAMQTLRSGGRLEDVGGASRAAQKELDNIAKQEKLLGAFEPPPQSQFIGPQETVIPTATRTVAGQPYTLSAMGKVPDDAFTEYNRFVGTANRAGVLGHKDVVRLTDAMERIKGQAGTASVADVYEITDLLDNMVYSPVEGMGEMLVSKSRIPKPVLKGLRNSINRTITENPAGEFKQYADIVRRASNNIEINQVLRYREIGKGQIGGYVKLAKDINLLKGIAGGAIGSGIAFSTGHGVVGGLSAAGGVGAAAWYLGTRPSLWVKTAMIGKGGNILVSNFLSKAAQGTHALTQWASANPKMATSAALIINSLAKAEIEKDMNIEYGIHTLDENLRIPEKSQRHKYAQKISQELKQNGKDSEEISNAYREIMETGELYVPREEIKVQLTPEMMDMPSISE